MRWSRRLIWTVVAGALFIWPLYLVGRNLVIPWLTVEKARAVPIDVSYTKASPNGKYLAIAPQMEEKLHLLDLQTGETRTIPGLGLDQAAYRTQWSPDSRHLLYPGPGNTLRVYEVESAKSWELASLGVIARVRWDSGGSFIIIERNGVPQIVNANASGQSLSLFPAGVEPLVVSIEPGDQSLGQQKVGKGYELVAVERPGATSRVVESDLKTVVAVAPDGRSWVVERANGRIELVPGAGGKPVTLPVEPNRFSRFAARWSPDGKWLALFGTTPYSRWEFFLIDSEGSVQHRSTAPFRSMSLDSDSLWWKADSSQFGFAVYHKPVETGKTVKLYVYDVTLGKLKGWRVPGAGQEALHKIAWADERTVYGQFRNELYRLRLR